MSDPVKFGSFKGMDNIHQPYELPRDTLRRAVNVDITDAGKVRRRKGATLAMSITSAHSLWSDGINGYFVQNNQLLKFNPNGTTTLMGAFLAGLNPTSFCATPGGEIYITCKTASAVIRAGVMNAWGLEVPIVPPTLIASTGTLDAGTYFAVVTYLRADGRESGASKQVAITLAAVGGIAMVAAPNPTDATITKKRLYLTSANGDIFYMVAEVLPSDQFVTIGTPTTGAQLRTAHLSPPPFGINLTYYKGRVFIVDAATPSVLWFTNGFAYDHVDTRKNFYQFGAPISNIIAVTDGMYVTADQTYFITNAGSDDAVSESVAAFGAIAGSAEVLPNSNDVIWMTERGPLIGRESGVIELIAESSISVGAMANSASIVREQDGIRQFLVVGNNLGSSSLQSVGYAQAEVIRQAAGG